MRTAPQNCIAFSRDAGNAQPAHGQEPAGHLARMGQRCAGRAIDCGHYLPEENPQPTAAALLAFFAGR
jgi:hypothetical protein